MTVDLSPRDQALVVKALRKLANEGGMDARQADNLASRLQFADRPPT